MNPQNPAGDVSPDAVLEALWTALKENYPAFEYVVGATGDAWRDEFRARLQNIKELEAALLILEELVNRFHDYHTTLRWPNKPVPQSPAVRLGYVEGGVAVVACRDDVPLAPGDVLHHIGETEAEAAFQKQLVVARGATVYARRQWACDRLLEGPAGSRVEVCAVRRSGRTETFRLERTGWPEWAAGGLESRELLPDTGYIRIPRWSAPQGVDLTAQFDDALAPFRNKPYLIIDVRGNSGGIDALADSVTGRFLRAPIVSSISFHRIPKTDMYEKTVEIARPRGPWRYEGRTAVLTDEGCASACEHFVSGMEASGAVALVGRPTTGACGWSKNIPLPGGAVLWCSLTFPFHGKEPSPLHGIVPHLLILPTREALRAGKDETLDAAIAYLRSGKPLPMKTNAI